MHIRIKRGLDLAIPGEPEQRIYDVDAPRFVGIVGIDYPSIRPALAVSVGDQVRVGDTLFSDRRIPELRVTAIASGTITAVHRGAKRKIIAIIVEVDGEPGRSFPVSDIATAENPDSVQIKKILLQSGLWLSLRSRPLHAVANPRTLPLAILINAIDTQPLAPDPAVVIRDAIEPFQVGARLVAQLCDTTILSNTGELALDRAALGRCRTVRIDGPHPAGLAGTQIERLGLAKGGGSVWVIGYQDVIAIGRLFASGTVSSERVVSVAGSGVERPRLVRTQIGASIDQLLSSECRDEVRVISGSPLSGRAVAPATAFLGRYDTQVTVLESLQSRSTRSGTDASMNGRPSGMLAVEAFERVWPFDAPPIPLLRALLADDVETADALGCRELHPEDLALCSYVCPAKLDYGAALSRVQQRLETGR